MIKILIVDDEVDIETLITQKFRRKVRREEWQMTFSRNGEEALKALKENPEIDIVLSDINMPKMDGLTLLQKIREEDFDIRTIMVSAYSDIENIRSAMNNGAFDFITKPINFEDMEITIERSFNNLKETRDALRSRNDLLVLKKELNLAHKIQQSILPKEFNIHPRCEARAIMVPAKEIGGDFYDFLKLDSKHIAFVVGDVSGKGVPAALFAMVNQTLLRSTSSSLLTSTSKVITQVNQRCSKNNDNCMFTTLFYGILNTQTGELTYTNAGHPAPLLIRANGECESLLLTGGLPLGISDTEEFTEKTTLLQPGDTLFVYTDGITEAINVQGEEFGDNRLVEELIALASSDLPVLNDTIYSKVTEFSKGASQFDDLTALSLRYKVM